MSNGYYQNPGQDLVRVEKERSIREGLDTLLMILSDINGEVHDSLIMLRGSAMGGGSEKASQSEPSVIEILSRTIDLAHKIKYQTEEIMGVIR